MALQICVITGLKIGIFPISFPLIKLYVYLIPAGDILLGRQGIMVKTETKMMSYLQCPHCGEFHKYEKTEKTESLVCLYCEEVFSTADFQPYAIAYRKTEARVSPF